MASEDVDKLKRAVESLRKEMMSLTQTSMNQSSSTVESTGKKEFGLQTLVQPWGGGGDEEDVETFLQYFENVAITGGWSDKEKLLICRSKLVGAARVCIGAHPELLLPTATFEEFRNILRARFRDLITPEQYLFQLNAVEQRPGEEVLAFADRCRRLGEKACPKTTSEQESQWAKGHFDRVIMSAFVRGLHTEIRRPLKFDPPQTFQEAIRKASNIGQAWADDPIVQEVCAVNQAKGAPIIHRPAQPRGVCYRCQKSGHFIRECPQPRNSQRREEGGIRRPSNKGYCFVCGSPEHFARMCPKRATRAVNECHQDQIADPKGKASAGAPPS